MRACNVAGTAGLPQAHLMNPPGMNGNPLGSHNVGDKRPAEPSSQQPQAGYSGHQSGNGSDDAGGLDERGARALKRPRLVWTPQLHQRFVDAVNQLGLKSAVPKTIMQVRSCKSVISWTCPHDTFSDRCNFAHGLAAWSWLKTADICVQSPALSNHALTSPWR